MEARDVEWLLQWAFKKEHVEAHRAVHGLRPQWSNVESHCRLGQRIDVSAPGSVSRSPFQRKSTNSDAKVILDVVQTLDLQVEIDWKQSASELIGEFGRLLSSNHPISAPPIFRQRLIVIECAETGTRPAWGRWAPRPKPEIGLNGKPILLGKRYASDRYSESACCPLVWENIEQLIRCRAAYAVWHSALCQLAVCLKGKLRDYQPLPPSAPAAPWRAATLRLRSSSQNA